MADRRAETFPDYPFASHWLDLQGIRMHYVDEGPNEGPPVIMLHGNPTWSFYFRRLISALAGGGEVPAHRVIAPDHIGMGLSDKPDESRYEFTLARRVADLEKLIESLNLRQPITLVLHDWGGMIGMAYAARHPEMIGRIVVLNTGAFRLPPEKKMPWQLKAARTPVIGSLLVRGFNAFSKGAVKQCVVRPLSRDVARAYCAPYDSWKNCLAVHRFIQDIPLRAGDKAFDLVAETEKKLAQFRDRPMLICWGMRDFVFDAHFLNRWIELFPAAQVHRFEDAGHYVLEDAHERIIPLVQSFLAPRISQALPAEATAP